MSDIPQSSSLTDIREGHTTPHARNVFYAFQVYN